MVSTRGVKFKFSEGERVLCYEPDPTKAKVLYESKVLRLVVTRDSRGRKIPEYLVHFQGWNSSWDRCVGEDFVLQDTPENRSLQRRLAQDAALNLKGRKRKKLPAIFKDSFLKKKCLSSDKEENSEDSEDSSDSAEDDEDEVTDNTEDEVVEEAEKEIEEVCNPFSQIQLSDKLKEKLEDDSRYITTKNKLVKLPCEPNIINILESYVKQMSVNLLCSAPNIKGTRQPQIGGCSIPTDIEGQINLSKELVDGLRVFFDFTLPLTLLYKEERQQFENIDILTIPDVATTIPTVSSFLPSVKDEPTELQADVKPPKDICQESLPWYSFHPVSHPSDLPSSPSGNKTQATQFPYPVTPQPICVSPKPNLSRQRPSSLRHSSFCGNTKILPPAAQSTVFCETPSPNNNSASSVATMRTRTWARSQSILKCSQSTNNSVEDVNTSRRILRSSDKSRQTTAETVKLDSFSANPKLDQPFSDVMTSSVGSSSNSPPPLLSPTRPDSGKPNFSGGQGPNQKSCSPAPGRNLPTLQQRLSPPLAPNLTSVSSVSSSASSTHSDSTMQTRQTLQETYISTHRRDPSGLLNKVLSWQMLPPAVSKKKPVSPSLVYGAQHLLRLFVKLPEYLERMSIPKSKKGPLIEGLQCFIKYIEERCDELLTSSAYKDVDDIEDYMDIKKENVT